MADVVPEDERPDPADLAALGLSAAEFEQRYQAAIERTRIADDTEPRALAIRYDRASGQFVVALRSGATFIFPARLCQGLAGADHDALADVVLTPSGDGFHWPTLDNDFSLLGLMMGSYGGKSWMAKIRSEAARQAGKVKSEAKAKAARENGKKGGRPRKTGTA
jgi:hypothetical protein